MAILNENLRATLFQDKELALIFRMLLHLREGTTIEIARLAGVTQEVAFEKLCCLSKLGLAKALPVRLNHEGMPPVRHYYVTSQAYANRELLAGVPS